MPSKHTDKQDNQEKLNPLAGFDQLPDSALVKLSTVNKLLDQTRGTTWQQIKDGILPAPVDIGSGSKRMRVGDLRAFLETTK